MTNESFGTFRIANQYLDDFERLDALFQEEGYLFFRGVLDLETVLRVKRDFIRVLQEQGLVKPGEAEAIWTGASIDQFDDDALYALDSVAHLLESAQTRQLIERVFGEPAFIGPGPSIRYALPNDDDHATPAHHDHFFSRANAVFRTLWMPLMDVDKNMGPLAIARGSHNDGLLDHVEQEVYSYILQGRKQVGIPVEDVRQTWLTIDYRPGDALIFHSQAIHRAFPNTSDRIRLSFDTRCQPKTIPRTWQMEKTTLELRKYRQDAQRLATEEGASEELFEVLIIGMMKRGIPVDRERIKALMAELSVEQQ